MIYFYDIFERVFSLMDDPDLSRKYYEDQAGYQSDLLDFLMVGKDKFTYPTAITDKLIVCDEWKSGYEEDVGSGSDTYTLTTDFPADAKKIGFTGTINGEISPITISIDENNVVSIIFNKELTPADTWRVTWFYAGAFSADFSSCLRSDFPMNAIMEKVITILAYATLSV